MFFKTSWKMDFLCSFFVFFLLSCHSDPSIPTAAPSEPAIYAVLFHEISPDNLIDPCASPDYFRDVLRMIQIGQRETVSAGDIVKFLRGTKPLEKSMIALTFDDGWGGNYTYAHPLLKEFGMKATAFVFTQGTEVGQPRRCSWDNLREMQDRGVWEAQSHSHTHPNLCKLDETALMNDLRTSLEQLRIHGLAQEGYIAYPFGYEDERVEKAALAAGFSAGFATGPDGQIKKDAPLFKIPRTSICQLFDQDLVCRKLGLNTKEIRKELAIFDEDDGLFTGEWKEIKSKEPMGMYGDSCRLSQNVNASWSVDFIIYKEGFYSVSLWTPTEKIGSTLPNVGVEYTIQRQDGHVPIRGSQYPFGRKRNGWTETTGFDLEPDTYKLIVKAPVSETPTETPFCVDAAKIEWVDPKDVPAEFGKMRSSRQYTLLGWLRHLFGAL